MATPAEELALLGSLKETVKVLGKTFVIETLDSDKEAAATTSASIFDIETRKHVVKMEKLARAIQTIDGVAFSLTEEEKDEDKTVLQKARETIFKWSPPVVRRVYQELEKMEKKRDKVVEDAEKNVASPTTGSTAGK